MRTTRQICAIALLTLAFSTVALGEEGWIGTGNKPPQAPTPTAVSVETPESPIFETVEEFSYFDEMYEATLLFLRMNVL